MKDGKKCKESEQIMNKVLKSSYGFTAGLDPRVEVGI